MISEELKIVKKLYGEEMMHLCRELFPTILSKPSLLLSILESSFFPSHSLALDIEKNGLQQEFKNYIYSFVKEKNGITECNEDPFSLIEKAGYTLFECKNENDIQSFRKYYKEDEIICTITVKNRLKRCYVFFAVKKNVDKIKREDFDDPKRDDAYGTSVISIQFDRGRVNTVSIKNRYNHAVLDPDCTFDNNLENIIKGLTRSFENKYGFNIIKYSRDLDFVKYIPYVGANNQKYYRYNCMFDRIYYCENNFIVDYGNVIDKYAKNKERYILMDYYILDIKEKSMYLYDQFIADSFLESIKCLGEIKKVSVKKDREYRIVTLFFDDDKSCEIKINSCNSIVSYVNNYVDEIHDNFMNYNSNVEYIELNNVKRICYNFLSYGLKLVNIKLQNVEEIGDSFLKNSNRVRKLLLPNVKKIGNNFLLNNSILEKFDAPNLREVDNYFLYYNKYLVELNLPNLLKMGDGFMFCNKNLKNLVIPRIESIGENVLNSNSLINIYEIIKSTGDKKK